MKKIVAIIPARYGSTRFPGKPLALIQNKPMIQWCYEKAKKASLVNEVIVATDDERIEDAVKAFNGKVMMTSPEHRSGTDRVAEVAGKIDADIIVNLQGDEPLIHPEAIDLAVSALINDGIAQMSSLKVEIYKADDYFSPKVVKVVVDDEDYALYFSRSPIPHYREKDELIKKWKETGKKPEELFPPPYKHLGIYVYEKGFLEAIAKLPSAKLENAEKLEQLRVMEWGFKIKVPTTLYDSIGVDTKEDLENIKAILEKTLNDA